MVGRTFLRVFAENGYSNILTATRAECDLTDARQVGSLFSRMRPEYVLHFAAKVGGIKANSTRPAEFLYENLMIQGNVIHQCHLGHVKQLIVLGSSCIYPRECPQPMKEEYLLTGPLEPTNEGYALAKIAGLKLAQYYERQYGLKCLNPLPCNLYGPNDHFDLDRAHVMSALARRFVDAQDSRASSVTLWGTGSARREFLHVHDLAEAVLFLAKNYQSSEIINVGTGEELSIRELSELIADVVGYRGKILWDTTMPDGMPRKCLDISRLRSLGYRHRVPLRAGIEGVVSEYRGLKKSGAIR